MVHCLESVEPRAIRRINLFPNLLGKGNRLMIFMWQITRDYPNGDCIPIASVCIGSLSHWSSLSITASYKYGI